MSEYVSPLDNESGAVRLVRAFAFFIAGFALIDLAVDQFAKSLGAFFVDKVTEPTEWDKYLERKEAEEGKKPDAT